MNSIAILGAGTWGIALAKMLKNTNKEVTVWSALPDEIEKLKKTSRHPKLPDVSLPLGIEYTTDIKSAIEFNIFLRGNNYSSSFGKSDVQ